MLNSIHIQGFKGFKDTKIEGLRKVNLILGGQNVGKTSLLEAFYASCSGDYDVASIESILNYANFRYSNTNRTKFWSKNDVEKFSLSLEHIPKNNSQNDFWKASCFNVFPTRETELVKLYINAVKNSRKSVWLNLLKKIEPSLLDLDQYPPDGESSSVVHANLGLSQLIPLSEVGQGFNRLAYLYAGLLGQGADIALIDEIENGIHYSALPTVFKGIREISESNGVQSIITTHSWECIRAACETYEDKPEDFQCIRLEREGDNVIAQNIPGDQMIRMM